jgi:ATP-binding cassette, subfamily B, bacterial PglK
MRMIKKILYFFSVDEQKHALVLLVMTIIMALLDTIGVASVLPFIAVLTNPELIETNFFLMKLYDFSSSLGVETNHQFLFFLGISVFLILVFSLAFKAITTYLLLRFCQMREFSIGKRLVQGYLHQPYSWFLNRDSADLGKSILSETSLIVNNAIKPLINIISQIMVTIALIGLLVIAKPKIALIVSIILGSSYIFIYKLSRAYLKQIGQERMKANESRFIAVSEAFGAAKEIKVNGLEKNYTNLFAEPAQIFARHQASSSIISQLPRYALEAISFGGMLLLILFLMGRGSSFNSVLPLLTLYAMAGYRMIPALQQIYSSITRLRFIGPALDTLYNDLKNLQFSPPQKIYNKLQFDKKITLKNISYSYPNLSRKALKDINLSIKANSMVGFVGATGSGKTTAVDIILGLLEAEQGTLEVDGQIINSKNVRAWQSLIGYVPQHIYLSNNTIAKNIAFGVDKKDINLETIKIVSKIANLHDFVVNELPKKYQTIVGERGVRLSGGQRQRIGIARALYHNPKLLILDEATSALDNLTEEAVMHAINKLGKKITIILIAHRLSTVKKCDNIFFLENGEFKAQGSFDSLKDTYKDFGIMAKNN